MTFGREATISVWVMALGLFVLLGSPMMLATAAFVLLMGVMALTIVVVLWKAPPPTIAEVLRHAGASRSA